MTWLQKFQTQRHQLWLEVEQFFAGLPPHLFQQGIQLKNNLATFYSHTGQFRDILSHEYDHPLLYYHLWLLDDLHVSAQPELARHIFLAMTFTFAAVSCQEAVLDEGSNVDQGFLFLKQRLDQQARQHWDQLFAASSSFWNEHFKIWDFYSEAMLADMSELEEAGRHRLVAGRLAFTKLGTIGTAHALDRVDLIPQLDELLDRLNFTHQLLRNISTLRQDLARRRLTYPILKTLQAAGINPHEPYTPERVLGALVLTDVMAEIRQATLDELATAQAIAKSLKLPTFSNYLDTGALQVEAVTGLFSSKPGALEENRSRPARPVFAPFVNTLPKVIEMAKGYLLSDLTFRESWEIQRRGLFGVVEMVGQAFPTAVVAEILARHGHDMSIPISKIYRILQSSGFRYYNHDHLPPDADDAAFLLRLFPYSPRGDFEKAVIKSVLALFQAGQDESGRIPVWLKSLDNTTDGDQCFVALWGDTCAAVEAHGLLGLLALNVEPELRFLETAATSLLERIAQEGVGAGQHYVPLYTIWISFELIATLTGHPSSARLAEKIEAAQQALVGRLRLETKRISVSPQDAALLTLACLSPGTPPHTRELFREAWITRLCKTQRYDGAWPGEALYGTPTRGEFAAWYASSTVTTAIGYHALKTYINLYR